MPVMDARGAGVDVHKKPVVACVLTPAGPETRPCGTMTAALVSLAAWRRTCGCPQGARESTGASWKPVIKILEGTGAVLLVHAQHVTAVPGRKTDVKAARGAGRALAAWVVRASGIPPVAQRALRDLTR